MSELTACDHAVIMSRFLIMKHFGGSASTTETFILIHYFILSPAGPMTKNKDEVEEGKMVEGRTKSIENY